MSTTTESPAGAKGSPRRRLGALGFGAIALVTAGRLARRSLRARARIVSSPASIRARTDAAFAAAGLPPETYAQIVKIAADAIVVADERHRVLLFNDAAEAMFGYTRSEVFGGPMRLLLPKGLDAPVVRARRKSGSEFSAHAIVRRLETGGRILVAVMIRDLTDEQRRFEEQAFLAEAGAVLGSSLSRDDTVTRIASLCVPFLADWCAIDLTDRDEEGRQLTVVHADPRKAALAARLEKLAAERERAHLLRTVLETRRPVFVTDVTPACLRSLAHDPAHLETIAALEVDSLVALPLVAEGECLGAIVLASSDRGRPYTPEALPVAEELTRRAAVAVRNARLYTSAQAAIRARDEILATVAHDLRSPLQVIEFAAERLRHDIPRGGRRADRSIDWILNSAHRATSLIRDLLDRARLEWQAFALDVQPLDPADVVHEVARRAEPLAAAGSLMLRVEAPANLTEVRGDRERVAQALENLVGNAIKFTPADGTVTIGAVAEGTQTRFFVTDSGPGIDADDLQHVFDRFWQGSGADTRGAGLGLSICKRIVEAHGGRIWVESTRGKGTTVSFTIGAAS